MRSCRQPHNHVISVCHLIVFCLQFREFCRCEVVFTLSCCQTNFRQLSDNHQLALGSCQAFIRQSAGSQSARRQSARSRQAVGRQSSRSHEIVIFSFHCTAFGTESLFSLVCHGDSLENGILNIARQT